jgi:hypothetical protein
MAWSNSKIQAITVLNAFGNTAAIDLDADSFKNALFDNTITPSNTVSAANTAFGAGVWASGEVFQAGQWATGGVVLTSVTWTQATTTLTFDAADTSSGSAATLASVYGCLIYDDTLTTPVADQGISYNYLGGSNSVTSGTLTVVYNASGILSFSVA